MPPKKRQSKVEQKDIPSTSDRPQQSPRAGSSANVGGVSDFATQDVQLKAQERLKRSDTTSSGRAPENPEGLVAAFREENKDIKSAHDEFLVHHAPHLEKSKSEILETAEASPQIEGFPKNALLLGVGNCYDIPLEELAKKFDHITIVEYDIETAKKAIEQLDAELQPKFEFIQADLTGIANELHEKLLKAVNDSNTGLDFIASATNIAKEINKEAPGGRPPRLRANNAFICSQLVMSQLLGTSLAPTEAAVMKKFDSREPFLAFTKSLDFQDLTRNVQKGHFVFMALSGHPGARVHFADTFMSKIDLPGEETADSLPLIDPAVIKPVMEKYFRETKPQDQWLFNQTPEHLTFFVRSHSLEVLPPPAITETAKRFTDIIDRITQEQSGPEVRDQIEKDLIQLVTQQQRDHVRDHVSEIRDLEQQLAASTREKEKKRELVNETIRRLATSTQINRDQSTRIGELDLQVADLTRGNEGQIAQIHHLEQQVDTWTQEHQIQSVRVHHLEQQLAASRLEKEELARDLELQATASTQQNQEIGDLEQQLAASRLEKEELARNLELQATASTQQNQQHSDQISHLEQQLAASRLEKEEQSDQISHLRHQLAASTRGNEGQRAQINRQDNTIGILKRRVTDLTLENQQQSVQQNDQIRHLTQQVTDLTLENQQQSVLQNQIRYLEQQLAASTQQNQEQIAQIEQYVRISMGFLQQLRSRSGGGTGISE